MNEVKTDVRGEHIPYKALGYGIAARPEEEQSSCQAQYLFSPIWCFMSVFACSLGVSHIRLTKREHMGRRVLDEFKDGCCTS